MSTPRGVAYYCAAVLALVSTTLTIVNAATMRTPATTPVRVEVTYTCPAEDDPGWDQFQCGDRTGVHIDSRKHATPADLWP